ncbi:MAG TPA: hypothetical protein VN677_05720 [Gemmatimonadaceae bacterium]|nr:hypothetical protein [Gemmatimonadaceae bacterium]
MPDDAPCVLFEPLFADVEPPRRATAGSAGYDVRAHVLGRDVCTAANAAQAVIHADARGVLTLEPGVTALVPLGFRARLPEGHEAQLRVRSSIAFRKGLILPNAPATIDADYPDEWLVMMKNDATVPVTIEHGERIAQIVFNRFEVLEWTEGAVSASTDRAGGFGSTG